MKTKGIPCFLHCGHILIPKRDKNGNPYLICDKCHCRFFVGGNKEARKRFEELIRKEGVLVGIPKGETNLYLMS